MGFLQGLADSNIGEGMKTGAGNIATGMAQNSVAQAAPQLNAQGTQDIGNDLQVQAMTPQQLDAGLTGQNPTAGMAAPHPMADASHPFWGALQSIAGMQNGGVVRENYGKGVIAPSFEKGPALPTGPNATAIPSFTQSPQPAGYEAGGVVNSARQQAIQVGAGRDQRGVGQGISPASTEGQVLTMDTGGVVPDGFVNPMGGPAPQVSGGAAGLAQGIAQGQVLGRNLHQAFLQHEARKSAADYAGNVTGIDAENQDLNGQQQPSTLDKARDAVEGFFHHLHEGTLNDQHQPNGPANGAVPATGSGPAAPQAAPAQPATNGQAIPSTQPAASQAAPAGQTAPAAGAQPAPATPATAAGNTQKVATAEAAKVASQDQQANAGIPQQSPEDSGKPHSLTPDYWRESQQKLQAAVRSAALAGEDPQKVYDSLTAMRNAHFQGQILRQLSAANTALMNGDEKSVRQALSNVNYYLPNGQGITFRNATADDVVKDKTGQTQVGQLMYRNPMYGLYGHQGENEYTSVTPQHLQLLGTAALDPRTVQETMLKTYSAQAAAEKEITQARGEYMTGEGRRLMGAAAYQKANIQQQMEDVDRRLKIATGNKEQAEANWYNVRQPSDTSGRPKITTQSLRAAQNDVATYVDKIAQGQPGVVPPTIDGHPNPSPAAGKVIPDATRIPSIFKGMTPEEQENTKVVGGQINSANVGISGMNAAKAADLAARITRYQAHPSTHLNPQTKQREPDVHYDTKNGTAHIWVGNGWENVYLRPNVADEAQDNRGIPSGGGGAGSEPADDDMPNNMG